MQAKADLKRKQNLVKTSAVSVAQLDESRAKRDSTEAALRRQRVRSSRPSAISTYTTITAPFDGAVSARLVDPGAMVGAGSPTTLATIVQVNPIYVNFNIDEQQVLTIRERMREAGVTLKDIGPIPDRHRPADRAGLPARRHARLRGARNRFQHRNAGSPRRASTTRTSADSRACSSACGSPSRIDVESLLVPDIALGNNQEGRYLLIVNDKNVVEQRQVEIGEQVDGGCASSRAA